MKALRGLPHEIEQRRNLNENKISLLLLNLTPACNYNCKLCYVGKKHQREGLGFEEQKEVVKQAKEMGAMSVVIPGEGEPLLDRNLSKLVRFIHGEGLTTVLYTNASRLTKQTTDLFHEKDVSMVINFPSLEEKVFNELTQTKNFFQTVIQNLEYIKRTYGRDSRRIAINFVLNRSNEGELRNMKEFCRDYFIFNCAYPVKEGNAIENWEQLVDSEEELQRFRKVSELESELKGQTMSLKGYCAFRDHGLNVTFNGEIIPCPASRDCIGIFGNVKEGNIQESYERVQRSLKEFYEKYGFGPCLKRHKDHLKFLRIIRGDKK